MANPLDEESCDVPLPREQAVRWPGRSPDRLWGGPSMGGDCAICGAAIALGELELEVEFDVSGGKMQLVVPYGMIEPIKELLDRSGVNEADSRDNRWELALKENIKDARVTLNCRVAETEVSLREVIDLEVGDVIAIEEPQPVLGANNIPLFQVRMGTLKGNLALQVLKKIERPR